MQKFSHPILTAEQQYENLLSKGLIMDQDKSDVVFFLTHHSYFKMMLYFRPYWSVDIEGNRQFNSGVTWSRILQDYYFDNDLRVLLFSYIFYIESSFKNTLCQLTCQKLGNTWRENVINFDDSQVFMESIQPILTEIMLGKSRHEHVQKYLERDSQPKNPPFRNMIEVFTFGQVVKMYKYLADQQIKKDIGKQYHLDESRLQSRMKTIVDVRNICCHHNKFFDKKNRKIINVKIIEPMLDGRYNTMYHVFCLMYYLLKQVAQGNNFVEDIEGLLCKYPDVETGFPHNWRELCNNI